MRQDDIESIRPAWIVWLPENQLRQLTSDWGLRKEAADPSACNHPVSISSASSAGMPSGRDAGHALSCDLATTPSALLVRLDGHDDGILQLFLHLFPHPLSAWREHGRDETESEARGRYGVQSCMQSWPRTSLPLPPPHQIMHAKDYGARLQDLPPAPELWVQVSILEGRLRRPWRIRDGTAGTGKCGIGETVEDTRESAEATTGNRKRGWRQPSLDAVAEVDRRHLWLCDMGVDGRSRPWAW
jgi:hypothetical protein